LRAHNAYRKIKYLVNSYPNYRTTGKGVAEHKRLPSPTEIELYSLRHPVS
jgi:hypothetical protein